MKVRDEQKDKSMKTLTKLRPMYENGQVVAAPAPEPDVVDL